MDMVIGIGNELRGDDGVGPRVVGQLPERPGHESLVVHQLAPELAERIQCADRVLFVDARLEGDGVRLSKVAPSPHRGLGHSCTPSALMEWTKQACGNTPEAWLLSIPGRSFDLGEGLSDDVEALVPEATREIQSWLGIETPEPETVRALQEEA